MTVDGVSTAGIPCIKNKNLWMPAIWKSALEPPSKRNLCGMSRSYNPITSIVLKNSYKKFMHRLVKYSVERDFWYLTHECTYPVKKNYQEG